MNEITDQPIAENLPQEIDRVKLREERRLRNKQKKAAKKLEKQKEREQKELILRLQPKSNNVILITRALADRVTGNAGVGSVSQNTVVTPADFPALGSTSKSKWSTPKATSDDLVANIVECDGASSEKKKASKLELADFLCTPSTNTAKQPKVVTETVGNYNGNLLDSDMPLRRRGKFREVPKIKRPSKLKRDILTDQSEEGEENSKDLLVTETNLCDNVVTAELEELIKMFISTIVSLQEKLYQRDPIKGTSKRRYVVGFHEVKKYLNFNKVKILIIAADIKLMKHDGNGGLNGAIKQIVDLAKANNVPYLFAIKRRLLGALTRKYIPVSCIAVLNYEGVEDHFGNITKLLPKLKEEYVVQPVADETHSKILHSLMEGFKCQ